MLLLAVDALPKDDRERVLVWLLDPAPGGTRDLWTLRGHTRDLMARIPESSPSAADAVRQRFPAVDPRKDARTHILPVLLPAERHAGLSTWCAAHDFSMATVIRGLVEKFLDGQAGN